MYIGIIYLLQTVIIIYTHFSQELSEIGTFCLRTWFS